MEVVKPKLRGSFHQAMFFITLGACIPLIIKSSNASEYIATSIYSIAVLMMFGFSTLYHRFEWKTVIKKRMRKLDHIGIFLMIAGSFTPIALLVIPRPDGLFLFFLIWCVAIFGAIQVILFPNINRLLRSGIYLTMGLISLPYFSKMFEVFSVGNSILIVLSAALYVIGAISYGLKYPKLLPKYFGYHEVFHCLVSVAAILHFIVIYSII